MNIHKNAALTPKSRAEVARRIAEGQPRAIVAKAFGICVKTAVKWFGSFQSDGEAAVMDRSSRPRKLYRPTPQTVIEQVIELRNTRIPGKEVARRLGLSAATVSRILRSVKLSRIRALWRKEALFNERGYQFMMSLSSPSPPSAPSRPRE
jgi:transposase